jgi:hypothetical protein
VIRRRKHAEMLSALSQGAVGFVWCRRGRDFSRQQPRVKTAGSEQTHYIKAGLRYYGEQCIGKSKSTEGQKLRPNLGKGVPSQTSKNKSPIKAEGSRVHGE